jgi:hypothetical protein
VAQDLLTADNCRGYLERVLEGKMNPRTAKSEWGSLCVLVEVFVLNGDKAEGVSSKSFRRKGTKLINDIRTWGKNVCSSLAGPDAEEGEGRKN